MEADLQLGPSCPICFEFFSGDILLPKKLPCSHVICLNCLRAIYKKNNSHIICPLCRNDSNERPSLLENYNENEYDDAIFCKRCNNRINNYNDIRIKPTESEFEVLCNHCARKSESFTMDYYIKNVIVDGVESNIKNMNKYNILINLNKKILNEVDFLFNQIKISLAGSILQCLLANFQNNFEIDILDDNVKYSCYISDLVQSRSKLEIFEENKNDFLDNYGIKTVFKELKNCFDNFILSKKAIGKVNNFGKFFRDKNLIGFKDKNSIMNVIKSFMDNLTVYGEKEIIIQEEKNILKRIMNNELGSKEEMLIHDEGRKVEDKSKKGNEPNLEIKKKDSNCNIF